MSDVERRLYVYHRLQSGYIKPWVVLQVGLGLGLGTWNTDLLRENGGLVFTIQETKLVTRPLVPRAMPNMKYMGGANPHSCPTC